MKIKFEKNKLNEPDIKLIKETLFGLVEEREYFEYKVKQSDLIDKVLEYLEKHKIPFTTDEDRQN
jgi:hypothetical protein